MATDYFLDIDGIKGEATDKVHAGKIQLLSFSWGASNTGSFASNSGGGAGKVTFSDFSFAMNINKASPELMLSCATGKHISKAQLICRKAGDKQQEYMKVHFTDLLVSSYQTSGCERNSGGLDQPELRHVEVRVRPAEGGWHARYAGHSRLRHQETGEDRLTLLGPRGIVRSRLASSSRAA
jgi:type VI secretion system secreted protein Hcp